MTDINQKIKTWSKLAAPADALHEQMMGIAAQLTQRPESNCSMRVWLLEADRIFLRAVAEHCNAGRVEWDNEEDDVIWLSEGSGLAEWWVEHLDDGETEKSPDDPPLSVTLLDAPPRDILKKLTPLGQKLVEALWPGPKTLQELFMPVWGRKNVDPGTAQKLVTRTNNQLFKLGDPFYIDKKGKFLSIPRDKKGG